MATRTDGGQERLKGLKLCTIDFKNNTDSLILCMIFFKSGLQLIAMPVILNTLTLGLRLSHSMQLTSYRLISWVKLDEMQTKIRNLKTVGENYALK